MVIWDIEDENIQREERQATVDTWEIQYEFILQITSRGTQKSYLVFGFINFVVFDVSSAKFRIVSINLGVQL